MSHFHCLTSEEEAIVATVISSSDIKTAQLLVCKSLSTLKPVLLASGAITLPEHVFSFYIQLTCVSDFLC